MPVQRAHRRAHAHQLDRAGRLLREPRRGLRRRRAVRPAQRGIDQFGVGLGQGAPPRHRAGLGAGPRQAGRRPEPGDAGRPRVLLRVTAGAHVPRCPDLRRALLRRGQAAGRGGRRPDRAHLPRFRLRPRVHHRDHPPRRGAPIPQGRVPGLRPSGHRMPPLPGPGRPLRQRLPRDRAASWRGAPHRSRRLPRLAVGVHPRLGMAGCRSHQRQDRRIDLRHHGVGTRLLGRVAPQGDRLRRRRLPYPRGVGRRHPLCGRSRRVGEPG